MGGGVDRTGGGPAGGRHGRRARQLVGDERGSVTTEAAIVAVVVLTIVFGILDAMLALTLDEATDAATFAAARTLAISRSIPAAQAAAQRQLPGFTSSCLTPLAVRAYDSATPTPGLPGAGYVPAPGALPATALFASVTLTCTWSYLTPFMPSAGVSMTHTSFVGLE